MVEVCDVCGKVLGSIVRVVVDDHLYKVCSFVCKDVVAAGRNVDVGCGIIDGDVVRNVRMCSECQIFSMPFNCFIYRKGQLCELMFVVFGRRKCDG